VCDINAVINGGPSFPFAVSSIPSGGYTSYCNGTVTVPAGYSYNISIGGWGAPALVDWYELR
jgi:hypothetical protein